MNEPVVIPIELSPRSLEAFESLFLKIANNTVKEMNDKKNKKEYMNKTEACDYLGISYHTINKMINDGLPIVNDYGVLMLRKKDIDCFIEEKTKWPVKRI
ncbi:DNA-binding protein [Macrococcoides goetzii]|nr:helix-turn-helix domain-containing protein [Macrococcus goetzii]TDM49305.1 DNA-binding protein [Macrococcus goetzii]